MDVINNKPIHENQMKNLITSKGALSREKLN